mmetsp:Transcript_72408/g.169583  ORF Transcript_72408/g.169583 Transcript_72408/m.169583 type:complete len:187 (+) Transcript_72408:2124-2684(+)
MCLGVTLAIVCCPKVDLLHTGSSLMSCPKVKPPTPTVVPLRPRTAALCRRAAANWTAVFPEPGAPPPPPPRPPSGSADRPSMALFLRALAGGGHGSTALGLAALLLPLLVEFLPKDTFGADGGEIGKPMPDVRGLGVVPDSSLSSCCSFSLNESLMGDRCPEVTELRLVRSVCFKIPPDPLDAGFT